jgi:hypothetical protein
VMLQATMAASLAVSPLPTRSRTIEDPSQIAG